MGVIWANFADHGMVNRGDIAGWKNKIKRQQAEIRRLRLQVKAMQTEPDSTPRQRSDSQFTGSTIDDCQRAVDKVLP